MTTTDSYANNKKITHTKMKNLVNSVRLVGRAGANAAVNILNNGVKVARVNLATRERVLAEDGLYKNETFWYPVVLWGKQAEIAEKFISKGQQMIVEGRLHNKKFVGRDGKNKYITEIVVSSVLLPGAKEKIDDTVQVDSMKTAS